MREVIVIGAGIVGVSLAHALTQDHGIKVTVLERDTLEPRGSTTYAPGFVGLYNDVPILTELAQESAAVYDHAGAGFRRSGGLELAMSDTGAAELHRRVEAARSAGLPAELLASAALPENVASFVDAGQVMSAAHFAADGSADVVALITVLRDRAIAQGARFLSAQEVTDITEHGAGVIVRTASEDRFAADTVVLAAGVWGPTLARLTGLDLPLFPVAHPYVYGAPASAWQAGPFVRWPEHHVYSRVHGDRLGIGTYDHRPVSVAQTDLDEGAALAWSEDFTLAVDTAQQLLRADARFVPDRRVNGVFAMTPDNLPFLGRHPSMPNVWIAGALWVTHAAGAAERLATALFTDDALPTELSVGRFDGGEPTELRDRALRLYRDIYANDAE